jgi:dolichol-phosphate mannosyltransferase
MTVAADGPYPRRAWSGSCLRLASCGRRGGRRLAKAACGRSRAGPADRLTPMQSISVVVPARDEAARIGPLLEAIVGAPGVAEVIVVDDQSSDGTADLARAAGARVVEPARPLPDGWAGKAWALQQGIEAATATGS